MRVSKWESFSLATVLKILDGDTSISTMQSPLQIFSNKSEDKYFSKEISSALIKTSMYQQQ